MTDADLIDIYEMRLYKQLRALDTLTPDIILAVCRIAVRTKTRDIRVWRLWGVRDLIDRGLSAADATSVVRALAPTVSAPRLLPHVHPRDTEELHAMNAEIAAGLRAGPMMK